MIKDKFELYRANAGYHKKAFELIDFSTLDAFHNSDVLGTIFGDAWQSVLITCGQFYFLHSFSKNAIGNTGWFDIEPFMGYAGPVCNTDDRGFIDEALRLYSDVCREENITAEIMRLNCILGNHIPFENHDKMRVFPAKEIVLVSCINEKSEQLRQFADTCRRRVKRGLKDCEFRKLETNDELAKFVDFYGRSLQRVNADMRWYFSDEFFERVSKSEAFEVYSVWKDGIMASASLVIMHPLAAYYFLAANSDDLVPGAGELLIYGIAQAVAAKNISSLILGGGNSTAMDDPLLRYKKKFARETHTFYMGKMIYNKQVFDRLCLKAVMIKPSLKDMNFFLKYRLVNQDDLLQEA